MAGKVPIDLTSAAGATGAAGLMVGGAGAGPPPLPLPPPPSLLPPGFPPPLPPPRWCMAVLSLPMIRCLAVSEVLVVPEVGALVVGWLVIVVEVVTVAVIIAMFPWSCSCLIVAMLKH
jgi:hypothetical protein